MPSNKIAKATAGLSLLLATGALLFLTLWPYAYRGEVWQDGKLVERTSASLIEENGWGILWALLLPVALSASGFLSALRPTRVAKVILWLSALAFVGFSIVSGFSIGLFYFPAALALLLAAMAHRQIETSA